MHSSSQPEPAKKGRSYLYEAPLFYLLLLALQRSLFSDPLTFVRFNPSPFWLGVLLFGLRYGLVAGLFSGAVSAGLTMLCYRLAGEAYRFDDLDFYIQPGLYVILGAAIGGVTDRFLHRVASLNMQIDNLKDRTRGLLEQLTAQQKAQRAIEQQVVSQMSSIVTLYHGSRDLGQLDRSALSKGMLEFFMQALHATKASLYLPKDGRWVLQDERGWEEQDKYPRELDYTQGIVGKAGSELRVVSVRDFFGADTEMPLNGTFSSDAIMAGPMQNTAGEVVAIFAVQAMPFLKFNSASVNLLTLLLDWGSEAMGKVDTFEDLKSKAIIDQEYGLYNELYFESRGAQEFERSKQYALPFSILLVSVCPAQEVSTEGKVLLLRSVSRLLKDSARGIDIVTRTPFAGAPFAVLMMTSTAEGAGKLKARLLESFAKLRLPGELRLGIGSFKHDMGAVGELVEQAKKQLG